MSIITLGNLVIDKSRVAVWIDGSPVALTYVEFELLYHLARHAGQVLSRRRLMSAVWRENGTASGDRKLTVHLSRLRTKLRNSHPWHIETYTRRGYGLMNSAERAISTEQAQLTD
jgi:DNA-binding response OmpR family regulator